MVGIVRDPTTQYHHSIEVMYSKMFAFLSFFHFFIKTKFLVNSSHFKYFYSYQYRFKNMRIRYWIDAMKQWYMVSSIDTFKKYIILLFIVFCLICLILQKQTFLNYRKNIFPWEDFENNSIQTLPDSNDAVFLVRTYLIPSVSLSEQSPGSCFACRVIISSKSLCPFPTRIAGLVLTCWDMLKEEGVFGAGRRGTVFIEALVHDDGHVSVCEQTGCRD